jgi:hypothetical protein
MEDSETWPVVIPSLQTSRVLVFEVMSYDELALFEIGVL